MRYIDELLGCHADECAWIFGKGPSLDRFCFDHAGEVRICINESLNIVPQPRYFFAHDEGPIRNVADCWPAECRAILQQPRAEFALQCSIPEEQLYVYEKRYADNRVRDMTAAGLAQSRYLYGNTGTVHCAIHFCRLIGASKIVLVGIDGGGGYAKRLGMPDGGAAHERIRRDSIALLEVMGVPYEFFAVDAQRALPA